jgi:RHS repeat-associated protein
MFSHGPLARTVLGQEQVQGLDYAYSINGWLAGTNSYALNYADMGTDGQSGAHQEVAFDAICFALHYFDNAYTAIGTNNYLSLNNFLSTTRYQALYNGNISAMTTAMLDEDEVDAGAGLRLYRYDQLNRITKAYWEDVPNTWNNGNMSNNTYTANKGYSTYSYDANGNILTLERYTLQGSPVKFDDFEYVYYAGTNRLRRVEDSGTDQGNDLPNGQTGDNYTYDLDGNLVADTQEDLTISWNVQGKVREVDKGAGPDLVFSYDPTGQRIEKRVKNNSTEVRWDRYYYLRDPQGNVMAVYSYKYEDLGGSQYRRSLQLDEQHVYGSSRHAVATPATLIHSQDILLTPGDFDAEGYLVGGYSISATDDRSAYGYQYRTLRGQKRYELTNHLGNVLSTIYDRKLPQHSSGTITHFLPDVSTWQDYLPFGMLMYHRHGDDGGGYRYGFQNQEKDDEIKGSGNSYDFGARIYDSRIGRWLSVDPQFALQPSWSLYKSFNNNPIIFADPDGKKEYLIIIMQDKDGNTAVFRKQTSMDIMTDGVDHPVPGWNPFGGPTATWSYENNYYDFERVITMTQNADGTITTTENLNILTDGPLRDSDYVWGNGAEKGDSKLDWSEWWESKKTGGSQPSGFHLVSEYGGIDQTRTKATEGGVKTIDIGPFLMTLGGLGRTPGKLPSIKDALSPAEFVNTIKDLTEVGQSLINGNSSKGSPQNYCPNCSDTDKGVYNKPHGTDTVQTDSKGNVTKDTRNK